MPLDTNVAEDRLYGAFERYSFPGDVFCGLCYTQAEIDYITNTLVRAIDQEHGRTLLWETADHWQSADVYRHYLPRLLELIGPPWFLDDIYPRHLFETMLALGFHRWPEPERRVVIDYLTAVTPEVFDHFGDDDQADWAAGLAALTNATLRLPAATDTESPSH